MTDTVPVHCFEKAGLGKAPFYCVGVASIPSPSLAAANPVAYNNAMAMLPRDVGGCGSCAYCGTAIMHNFIIKSSDGRRFVVGCDCVARTGDAGLIKEVRAERLKQVRAKREESRRVGRAEREKVWAAERAERAAVFAVEHSGLIERCARWLDVQPFIKDVLDRHLAGSFVSEKALGTVERVIADLEQRERWRVNSRHVGTVGQRLTVGVVVSRVNHYVRPCFGAPWRGETVWIVTMRDEAGNALVSKSPSFHAKVGEALKIKATVKEHNAYDGEQQTIVQRIKVV